MEQSNYVTPFYEPDNQEKTDCDNGCSYKGNRIKNKNRPSLTKKSQSHENQNDHQNPHHDHDNCLGKHKNTGISRKRSCDHQTYADLSSFKENGTPLNADNSESSDKECSSTLVGHARTCNKSPYGIRCVSREQFSSPEDEEQVASRNEIRRKSKEIQSLLNKKQTKMRNGARNVNIKEGSPLPSNLLESLQFDTASVSEASTIKRQQIKQVILTPDYRSISGNESSGVELCQKLFGITIFQYSNGRSKIKNLPQDRKLVVQSIVEGSSSQETGKIHRGDMLVRINDVHVTWSNFSQLIRSLRKREKVKLTFQSPRIVRPKSVYNELRVPEDDLCLSVLGKHLSHIQSELLQIQCVVLFLTLVRSSNESEDDKEEDIIYAFPPGEESLTSLRGLFMTVSSFVVDVVDQKALCSRLLVNNSLMTVAYQQCGNDVLIFAVPENRISPSSAASVLEAFTSLMMLLFADLKSAFNDCDRTWLDTVLAILLHQALGVHSLLPAPSFLSLPYQVMLISSSHKAVRTLHLSHDNRLICDEILSELEAMDFDDFLDHSDLFSRRQYTICGTSLFYKDRLICSHTRRETQRNINLFLNFHGLLVLSARQQVDDVKVWQEIKAYTKVDDQFLPAGYTSCTTRNFLMVVGLHHYLLALIVEAGGCSASLQGPARPMHLMQEQGKATLAQLETDEVHMSKCCEESLSSRKEAVRLMSADLLCTTSTPRNKSFSRENGLPNKLGAVVMPTKQTSETPSQSRSKSLDRLGDDNHHQDASNAVVMRRQGSKLSYESNDSAGSGSSTGPSKSKGSRVSSSADLSSIARSLSVLHIDAPHDVLKGARLSRGRENTLFSYLHFDSSEGILICPTEADIDEVQSVLQDEIVDNFCKACHSIRNSFQSQSLLPEDNVKDRVLPFVRDKFGIKEQGILFHCTLASQMDKKQTSTLNYWVVGRQWVETSQEMYVCFHEMANQSLVEMAFSLGFGT